MRRLDRNKLLRWDGDGLVFAEALRYLRNYWQVLNVFAQDVRNSHRQQLGGAIDSASRDGPQGVAVRLQRGVERLQGLIEFQPARGSFRFIA
jgi:hypothetical protein